MLLSYLDMASNKVCLKCSRWSSFGCGEDASLFGFPNSQAVARRSEAARLEIVCSGCQHCARVRRESAGFWQCTVVFAHSFHSQRDDNRMHSFVTERHKLFHYNLEFDEEKDRRVCRVSGRPLRHFFCAVKKCEASGSVVKVRHVRNFPSA